MTPLLSAATSLLLALTAAPAGTSQCKAITETTQKSCAAAAPREKRNSEPYLFHRDLCRIASRVATKACERGVFQDRYHGPCTTKAEFVGDAMSEACRIALYRDPKPYVKVWFKMYDERCRKNTREAGVQAARLLCMLQQDAGADIDGARN